MSIKETDAQINSFSEQDLLDLIDLGAVQRRENNEKVSFEDSAHPQLPDEDITNSNLHFGGRSEGNVSSQFTRKMETEGASPSSLLSPEPQSKITPNNFSGGTLSVTGPRHEFFVVDHGFGIISSPLLSICAHLPLWPMGVESHVPESFSLLCPRRCKGHDRSERQYTDAWQ